MLAFSTIETAQSYGHAGEQRPPAFHTNQGNLGHFRHLDCLQGRVTGVFEQMVPKQEPCRQLGHTFLPRVGETFLRAESVHVVAGVSQMMYERVEHQPAPPAVW